MNKIQLLYYESFKKFLNERNAAKKSVYIRVSVIGFTLAIASLFIYTAIWNILPWYESTLNIIAVVTTFTRVVGICIFSIVPQEEFNFIRAIAESNIYRRSMQVFLVVGWIYWGYLRISVVKIVVLLVLEVIPPFSLSLYSLWCLYEDFRNIKKEINNEKEKEKKYFQVYVSFFFWILYLAYDSFLSIIPCTVHTCDALDIIDLLIFILFFVANIVYTFQRYNSIRKSKLIQTEKLDMEEGGLSEAKLEHRSEKEFEVTYLYNLVYQFCIVVAFFGLSNGIYWIRRDSKSNAEFWFLLAFFDLLPIIVVKIIGSKFSFTLLARIFEFSVRRQQDDGAFMSALVSKCQVHPFLQEEKILWIKRRADVNDYQQLLTSKSDAIDRRFWIKATIEKEASIAGKWYYYIRVDYDEDTNIELNYHFKKDNLVQETLVQKNTLPVDCKFDSWLKHFEEYDQLTISERSVCFWCPCSPPPAGVRDETFLSQKEVEKDIEEKKEKMLKWGVKNLRSFDSHKFFDSKKIFIKSFFTSSPRELSSWNDEDEKELLKEMKTVIIKQSDYGTDVKRKFILDFLDKEFPKYAKDKAISELLITWKKCKLLTLSNKKSISSRLDKIDYFISHSWVDNSERKCDALKAFIGNKFPSFWFDKVCIDQNDVTNGIEALPINIGACKKVLVLMGNTYMKRLWCIWELFMLFTFCNKELGLERMQIICIDDDVNVEKEVRGFDIDKAHAFDPNEEYRLRFIMLNVVGEDKVKESFEHMANLVKQKKVSTIDYMPKLKIIEDDKKQNTYFNLRNLFKSTIEYDNSYDAIETYNPLISTES